MHLHVFNNLLFSLLGMFGVFDFEVVVDDGKYLFSSIF